MAEKLISPLLKVVNKTKSMINPYMISSGMQPILNMPLSADANDISGNGLNGTLYGSPSFTTPVNGVLNLGTGKYMTMPDSDLLSFCDGSSDKPFSVSLRFKSSNDCWLINKRSADGPPIEWQIAKTGTLGIVVNLFNNNSLTAYIIAYTGSGTVNNNEHHIVVTYTGNGANTGFEIYLDNVKKTLTRSSVGTYTKMVNTISGVTVGKQGWAPTGYISDYIKKLKIYNYVISEAQITELYNES
jgi:hypothetical protein